MLTLTAALSGIAMSALLEIIAFLIKPQKKRRELGLIKAKQLFPPQHCGVFEPVKETEGNSLLVSSIRPLVTYSLFLMFCFTKFLLVYSWVVGEITIEQLNSLFWDLETKAFFAAVIGFWFGHRAFARIKCQSK